MHICYMLCHLWSKWKERINDKFCFFLLHFSRSRRNIPKNQGNRIQEEKSQLNQKTLENVGSLEQSSGEFQTIKNSLYNQTSYPF